MKLFLILLFLNLQLKGARLQSSSDCDLWCDCGIELSPGGVLKIWSVEERWIFIAVEYEFHTRVYEIPVGSGKNFFRISE